MSWFIEDSLLVFLVMTVIIAGGAAFMSGRGLASGWRPIWMPVLYMIPMGLALRFFHYALFDGDILGVRFFIIDTVVLIAFALFGYRLTLTSQMVNQYPWLYERSGPLSWRAKT